MLTDSYMDTRSNMTNVDLQVELESLLHQHRNRQSFPQPDVVVDVHRSGSAPPTVEGLLRAMDNKLIITTTLITLETLRTSTTLTTAASSFYPTTSYVGTLCTSRTTTPTTTRTPGCLIRCYLERIGDSLRGFTAVTGEWRKNVVEADNNSSSSSLFKVQPGVEQAENDLIELRNAVAQGRHVLQRLDPSGLGPRRKSFADILHDNRDAALYSQLSRPASCNTFHESLHSATMLGSTMSSPVPRNRTPDSHLVGRSPSSGLSPIGTRVCGPVEKNNLFGVESYTDVADTLSRLNMSEMSQVKDNHMRVELENHSDVMRYIPNGHKKALRQQSIAMTEPSDQLLSANYGGVMSGYGASLGASSTVGSHGEHVNIPKRTSSSASHYSTSDRSRLGSLGLSDVNIQNANINGTDFSTAGGYVVNNKLNSLADLYAEDSHLTGEGDRQILNRLMNQAASELHS
uniref:Nucleic acid binding NABP domain-containing protein n=1 Tax=Brassica oleracea var. oleracea TaxID=109376 RepID=A0A0D3CLG7_BRAOL